MIDVIRATAGEVFWMEVRAFLNSARLREAAQDVMRNCWEPCYSVEESALLLEKVGSDVPVEVSNPNNASSVIDRECFYQFPS